MTQRVVRQQLGTAPPRPVLVAIERRSGGNPFFALQLARAAEHDDRLVAHASRHVVEQKYTVSDPVPTAMARAFGT